MKTPFFSIIIPTLNEESSLPLLLSDLISQTFQDFEIIVVDGHSKDNTVEKATKLAPKLPSLKIINSKIRQVCVQRNLGSTTARANLLIFMDADNRLPSYFLQGIKYRLEMTKADILTTWFKPDLDKPSYQTISYAMNLSFELQNAISYSFMIESMIIISNNSFQKIGGFDTNINYAEGRPFVKKAKELGLTLITVKDPVYSYSFRRFRKFGLINVFNTTSKLALISMFGKNFRNKISPLIYPMMGGSQYSNLVVSQTSKKSLKKFVNQIEKIFQEKIYD